MFPFEIDEEEVIEDETPKEFGVDFETGELTGEIVEGLEAIKIWIMLALNTPRYRHTIYTWDYGNEIEDLIGQGYSEDYIETETVRMIEECLTENEYIESIDNLSIDFSVDKLSISFTVNTAYGEIEVNV